MFVYNFFKDDKSGLKNQCALVPSNDAFKDYDRTGFSGQ